MLPFADMLSARWLNDIELNAAASNFSAFF